MPKVSVIIPTYNSDHFVCEAIDSILAQTYTDYEIIVVDDGSTDNTKNMLSRYANRIKCVKQNNQGVSAARNTGIKLAKGQYIAFLDADDKWLPIKLEKSLDFLEKGGFDWICTSRFKLREDGHILERNIEPESGIHDNQGRISELEIGLFNLHYVLAITSTVVIKISCIEICGFFDETLRQCEDLDLLMRFKEAGLSGGYLDEPLIVKRSHDKNLSKTNGLKNFEYTIKVARKHARILHLDKIFASKLYGEFWWQIALSYYLNNSIYNTMKYSIMSLFYYPNMGRLLKMFKYGSNLKK